MSEEEHMGSIKQFPSRSTIDYTSLTGIIYPLVNLQEYIVEIKQDDKSYFISEDDELVKYGNLELAKLAALAHGVDLVYLAFNRTDSDSEFSRIKSEPNRNLFEYMRLPIP